MLQTCMSASLGIHNEQNMNNQVKLAKSNMNSLSLPVLSLYYVDARSLSSLYVNDSKWHVSISWPLNSVN